MFLVDSFLKTEEEIAMEGIIEKPKILIVFGYHSEEIFAIKVGKFLLRNNSHPDIIVTKYAGEPDIATSDSNLMLFIDGFGSHILPVVLHSDIDLATSGAIIYYARSRQEKKKILKILFDFAEESLFIFDLIVKSKTKLNLVELELNPKIKIKKAAALINSFSEYLLKSFK